MAPRRAHAFRGDPPTGPVSDEAAVLDPGTRVSLERLLIELHQKTGAALVVATVPSLEGKSVEEAATEIFNTWGIGKKGDDRGVLFLIAPNERKMRVEVGYGLEGLLPDGRVGRILDEAVVPEFKRGDMKSGVMAGAGEIARVIAADAGVELTGIPQRRQRTTLSHRWFFIILLLIFFLRPRRRGFFYTSGGRGGYGGGGFSGGGGFGGFGGGSSGGGGASRGW